MSIFDDAEGFLDVLGGKIKKKLKESKQAKIDSLNEEFINDVAFNDVDINMNMSNINFGIGNKSRNTITINGESFEANGNNIVVKNNKVIVNGKTIKDGLKGIVKIEFTGDLASLDCETATIDGNVKGDVDGTTITVAGNVEGDVDCTTIRCGNVRGDVDGTNIVCETIHGDVDAVNIRRN